MAIEDEIRYLTMAGDMHAAVSLSPSLGVFLEHRVSEAIAHLSKYDTDKVTQAFDGKWELH